MAKVTVVPIPEPPKLPPVEYRIQLSEEEARQLSRLLSLGISQEVLDYTGLRDLHRKLRDFAGDPYKFGGDRDPFQQVTKLY